MLSAYPPGQTPPEPFPIVERAVLHAIAAYDVDPARYVDDGTITKPAADFAYNLRPAIAAERAVIGANETEIVARVSHKVDVWLGLTSA